MKQPHWWIATGLLLTAAIACASLEGEGLPGAMDPSFQATLASDEIPEDVVMATDGSVYVLLNENVVAKNRTSLVIRFLPEGARDPQFLGFQQTPGKRFEYSFSSIKTGPGGRIYLEGGRNNPSPGDDFDRPNPTLLGPLTLLRSDGSMDEAYGTSDIFHRRLHSYHPTTDGRVWAAGRLAGRSGESLVRLTPSGDIDSTTGSLHAPREALLNVNSVLERPGGRLLLAGQIFWKNLAPTVGFLQFGPDGKIDPEFKSPREGFNRGQLPNVWQAALDRQDRILVAGHFELVGNHATTNVARLHSNGEVDPSFRVGPVDESVEMIWEAGNGQVLVSGRFSRIQEMPRPGLARLNHDGTLDATYAPELPTESRVIAIADGGSGRVLAAGTTKSSPFLIRLLQGHRNTVSPAVLREPEGVRKRVGGSHSFAAMLRVPPGARLQWRRNGESLPGATNAYLNLPRLRMEDNGSYRLHVESDTGSVTTTPVLAVVQPAAAIPGSPDMSVDFDGGPDDEVRAIQRLPGSKLLVGGDFMKFGTHRTGSLVVLDADGHIDLAATQRIAVFGRVEELVPDGDGMLVAGAFSRIGDHATYSLARLNSDGTIDRHLQSRLPRPSRITSVARLGDGSFLVSGTLFHGPNLDVDWVRIARLLPNGELDVPYVERFGFTEESFHIKALPDGRIFLAGWSSASSKRQGFVRFLESVGTLAAQQPNVTFRPLVGIERLTTVPFGTNGILMAGSFSFMDPVLGSFAGLAEFQNGEIQKPGNYALPADAGILPFCAALDPEGRLVISAGLRGRNQLLRSSSGQLDPAFRSTIDGAVTCMVANERGDLYVGGLFRHVGDVVRKNLAKLYGSDRQDPYLLGPFRSERGLLLQFETNEGWNYEVQSTSDLGSSEWVAALSFQGDGKVKSLEADTFHTANQFFRVRARP
jgi:uncharacterized delta-60 repeat protein